LGVTSFVAGFLPAVKMRVVPLLLGLADASY
jgi:hypothetical protein